MSEIKVNSIKGVGASAAAISVDNSNGTCTLASGSKLNNCTTDGTTNLTIADGNLVVGTSGHGIDFSATSGSGTSELLDDYEDGIYEPTLTGIDGTTSITLYENKLGYVKIGKGVFITGRLRMNVANYSGGLRMSLPFTATSGSSCSGCGMSAVATHGVNFPNSDDMGLFLETFAGQALADFIISRDNNGWINATSSHIAQYNYLTFNHYYKTA